ncbi:MAG: hypothetical protein AAB407_04030 [Patescibacteria group bacterium]
MSAQFLSLQKARESVQVCPPIDTRLKRTELRERQLAATRTELVSVLPVEGMTGREVISQRVELLERVIEDPTFEERYPYLNMEVLGWRDEQGFPRLAPFALGDPTFSIEAVANDWMSIGESWEINVTQFPLPMARMYNDILAKFRDECRDDARKQKFSSNMIWRRSITTRFTGVIPQWVRGKIKEATSDFSVSTPRVEIEKVGWLRKHEITKTNVASNIFLIAEVDKWVVNKEVVLRPDPLVVGYKAGCLWFICSFDETPLENYVRMEFTV